MKLRYYTILEVLCSWLGSTKFTLFSPNPNSSSLFFPTLLYPKLLTILSSVFLFLNVRLVFSLQSLIAFWYLLYLEFPARCTNRNYDAATSRLLVFHNQDYFAIKTYLSRTVRAYNSLPYSIQQFKSLIHAHYETKLRQSYQPR